MFVLPFISIKKSSSPNLTIKSGIYPFKSIASYSQFQPNFSKIYAHCASILLLN